MKITHLLLAGLFAFILSPSSRAAATTYSTYTPAATPTRIGLGLATSEKITGSPTALTAMFDLRGDNWIQTYFSLPSTSPFQFGIAGLFKHTILETMNAGIHIGGGLGIGTLPNGEGGHNFALAIDGVVGVHFAFPGASALRIDLDAGPSFQIVDGNTNFSIGALSPALGLSVLYFF